MLCFCGCPEQAVNLAVVQVLWWQTEERNILGRESGHTIQEAFHICTDRQCNNLSSLNLYLYIYIYFLLFLSRSYAYFIAFCSCLTYFFAVLIRSFITYMNIQLISSLKFTYSLCLTLRQKILHNINLLKPSGFFPYRQV